MENKYLAIDIGASSGRHIVGWIDNGEIRTEEVYRFGNGVVSENGHLVWDMDALSKEVVEGIKIALEKHQSLKSLSIDTWGVDYVLMCGDEPIYPVYSYRDDRTKSVIDKVHERVSFEELYTRTGIQFQPFNTIYQLYDDMLKGRLDKATDFLMIPEYLSFILTGVKTHEYTNATTTGLVNALTRQYDEEIVGKLGLPNALFSKIDTSPYQIGKLKSEIAQYAGGQLEVVMCASHDTGSAVCGIDMEDNEIYLSSGTWSLLGVKLDRAITNKKSLDANYSNEGGVGYIRYLKNIMGMWIVNNLKAELAKDESFDYIKQVARDSNFDEIVDVTSNDFLAPKSMKEAFDSNLKVMPQSVGDYFKCAFLSLAHGYKKAIDELSKITGKQYHELYIVGGGAKNEYLNEIIESVCNINVVALPIEATAIGNLKLQAQIK